MSDQNAGTKKSRRIYSTESINQLLEDRKQGYEIDYSPFFEKDLDLRAAGVVFRMTDEEYSEYLRCYKDPIYFIENYCKFRTDKGYTLVKLRDFQKDIIRIATEETYDEEQDLFIPKNRNIIWMAARQSSKTTTLCAILAYKMIFSEFNCICFANKEDTSKELIDKTNNIFKGLPYFLKPGCTSFGKTGLRLENGSKLLSSATTNTASIGFILHFMILDEFAHIPENIVNNFWRSVYPTLSSSRVSQCMIISTPNGTTNKFYEIWSKSLEGKNSFVNMRTDYWQVPGHDEAWAAQQKADFGEAEFAQEFELQFNKNSKMLMSSSTADYIDRIVKTFEPKLILTHNKYLEDDRIMWDPNFDPNNISPDDKFLFLVDIAEGNGDEFADKKINTERTPDDHSINIFRLRLNSVANIRRYSEISCRIEDCFRFEQVGRVHFNDQDEIYLAKMCSALAYNLFHSDTFDNVRIALEMNFEGKSFYEEFKRHSLYVDSTIVKTYHRKPTPGEKQRKKAGFKTTSNKEFYCNKGNKLLEKKRIIIKDKYTFEQMKYFGYVRGKLKGIGWHDDLSMPVFNHIPRMLDESSFRGWLEESLMNYSKREKVYEINEIIQKWALDNPSMSDDSFTSLYGLDERPSQPFAGIEDYQSGVYPQSAPYSNLSYSNMGNPFSENNYYNGFSYR